MSHIHFFLGVDANTSLTDALARSSALPAWAPFDPRAVAFVGKFSQKLLTHPRIREYPELAALAHWFRPARLRDLGQRFREPEDAVVRGRGLVFHLAPANVDSVAMYSWLIAFLAGNVNWVRVSQKPSAQLDFILTVLQQTLDDNVVGEAVMGRVVLFTYAHDEAVTQAISAAAMCRVVWGGDATVAAIRAIPLRPSATELCFPDRFSAAAISARAVLAMDEAALSSQAAGFYNDAFWFGQQACSSPRLLAWVGNAADSAQAQQRFWAAVQAHVDGKQPEITAAMHMDRLGAAFDMAAKELAHPASHSITGAHPLRLDMEKPLHAVVKELHCGNGLFLEQRLDHLHDLAPQLTDKEQTLAVLGFERAALLDFVDRLPARAIDRIVPFGEALSFSPVWDGVDLFAAFTRQISLPPEHHKHSDNRG
jgi:hypothetical protein